MSAAWQALMRLGSGFALSQPLTGGRERTEREFEGLLERADPRPHRIWNTGSALTIVEAGAGPG